MGNSEQQASIIRSRDEWFYWLLTVELGGYASSAPVAALYQRRLSGDEPTRAEWAAAAAAAARYAAARYAAAAAARYAADADAAAAARYAAAAAAAAAAARKRIARALVDILRRNGVDPTTPGLDCAVLRGIEAHGLDMSAWHCGTSHCRAGWAVTVAPLGLALEAAFGPELAGRVIYLASTGNAPDFFCGDDEALTDIQRCAAEQRVVQP